MPRLKVVQCSSAHAPRDARIFHKHCLTLARAGYEVVQITPALYGGSPPEEIVEGVRVLTFSRAHSRLGRMVGGVAKLFRMAWAENAAFYHLHDPELIPAGILLKLLGKRVFYDVHEDLPLTIAAKPWVPRWGRRPLEKVGRLLEQTAALLFDAIVAATPAIARNFAGDKTIVVQNFPEKLWLPALLPYEQREAALLYIGIISANRGVRQLLDAVQLLSPAVRVRLVLGGHFENAHIEKELRTHPAWDLVEYHPWQPREQVTELLARSRVGAVVLQPCANFLESWPLKLFEYMAAGLPVIASDFPLWREIVAGSGCGLLVDPSDVGQVAQAIRYLLEHPASAQEMGECGRKAVGQHYSWEAEGQKLVALYRRLVPDLAPTTALEWGSREKG